MGSAKREIVCLNDVDKNIESFYLEGDDNFKIVETKVLYYDLKECCVDIGVVFQRQSDNKYFKGIYVEYKDRMICESQLWQVTKKTKVIDYFIY